MLFELLDQPTEEPSHGELIRERLSVLEFLLLQAPETYQQPYMALLAELEK